MKLQVNGDTLELPAPCNLDNLIRHLGLAGRRLAVEINGEILPHSEYATRQLAEDDRVEIVQAIGGGQTGNSTELTGLAGFTGSRNPVVKNSSC
jgi:thiamine biosynthesis protein ThiS